MNINYDVGDSRSRPSRTRLSYGATPLNPWSVRDYDQALPYGSASIDRINILVRENIELINPERTPEEVRRLLGEQALSSLQAIHIRRITYHNDNPAQLEYPDKDVLYAAEQGMATPHELFGILLKNPHMQAVELAKLSNPFDKESGELVAMHDAINQIIIDASVEQVVTITPFTGKYDEYESGILPARSKYKVKRTDERIPACILSRKQVIAAVATPNGDISIVRRQTLQVRGDEAMREDGKATEYLHRRIRNAHKDTESLTKLSTLVDYELDEKTVEEQAEWIQPVSTSYYAHYSPVAKRN